MIALPPPAAPPPQNRAYAAVVDQASVRADIGGKRAETVLRPIDPGLDRAHHTRDHRPQSGARPTGAEREGQDSARPFSGGGAFGTLLRLPFAAMEAIGRFLMTPGLHIERHGPATHAYQTAAAITRPQAHRTIDLVI